MVVDDVRGGREVAGRTETLEPVDDEDAETCVRVSEAVETIGPGWDAEEYAPEE